MNKQSGFTLIELSIVLVIIGLIVGGVLVGQDLIRAAYIRAQISQIEKFNTAVNTFYGKFQALPGDMNNQTAQAYGFSMAIHNGGTAGQGNGDGILDSGLSGSSYLPIGNITTPLQLSTVIGPVGETSVFWEDLSSSVAGSLIEGNFTHTTEQFTAAPSNISGTILAQYLPSAKLGNGNYVYVTEINGVNYYGIENVQGFLLQLYGSAGMTVAQAYNIDRKIDDANPTTGNVAAMMVPSGIAEWAIGGGIISGDSYLPSGSLFSGVAATAGNAASSTTCFDAPAGGNTNYSMEINGGAGLNCSLIFKMQGGD
jgi:prepilin-type N-terminal cleavage/methylation domain-containing protein